MKKKDILFLCQFFYPEYISSATLPWDMAVSFAENGYKVEALCGYPKEYNDKINVPINETINSVKINRIKYIETSRKGFFSRLLNYFSLTFMCLLNLWRIKDFKSVIVFSNPPILPLVAVVAKKIFGTKIVFVCYDVYPEIAQKTCIISETGAISCFMNIVNRLLYKNADKVVALSEEMKQLLMCCRKIDENKINVIPNWYEDNKKDNIMPAEKLKGVKNEGDFLVAYYGNMGICQDIDTIIEAIKLNNNPNIKFIFAGHGNKTERIKSLIASNEIKSTFFYDFLMNDEYKYALHISDCFLVSLSDGLSGLCVPSKTYSYMSEGKPIFAIIDDNTDIAKDLTDGNAGFVLRNNDSQGLIKSICNLYTEREKYKTMSENCRIIFETKYTKDICLKKYNDLLKQLIG